MARDQEDQRSSRKLGQTWRFEAQRKARVFGLCIANEVRKRSFLAKIGRKVLVSERYMREDVRTDQCGVNLNWRPLRLALSRYCRTRSHGKLSRYDDQVTLSRRLGVQTGPSSNETSNRDHKVELQAPTRRAIISLIIGRANNMKNSISNGENRHLTSLSGRSLRPMLLCG